MSSISDGSVAVRRLTERELAEVLDRADRFEFARRDQVYRHLARVAAETLGYRFAAEPVEPDADAEMARRGRAAREALERWTRGGSSIDAAAQALRILRGEVTP